MPPQQMTADPTPDISAVTLAATMARNGLHPSNRKPWYDDNDVRHDPLEDRELVLGLLLDLDRLAGIS